jgi:octanoyl-[GcvH]:protein N-octanoyltransferase
MPKPAGTLDIYDDFSGMASFLSAVLAPAGIGFDTGEVTGSYCPGEYDLSIKGRKFCGIAQRRRLDAYSVQAFVIAEGDGVSMAETARSFYQRACGGRTDLGAPMVDPAKMASLEQLTDGRMSAELFLRCLRDLIQTWDVTDASDLPKRYEAETNRQIKLMRERYDR